MNGEERVELQLSIARSQKGDFVAGKEWTCFLIEN